MSIRPSQEDINFALNREWEVSQEDWELYMEYMNDKPMTSRTEDRELRDGCILSGLYHTRRKGE